MNNNLGKDTLKWLRTYGYCLNSEGEKSRKLKEYIKEHYSYIALVMGFIGVLLIHGILDYTIFWIHTGLFFLFVLSSFEMFETNRN